MRLCRLRGGSVKLSLLLLSLEILHFFAFFFLFFLMKQTKEWRLPNCGRRCGFLNGTDTLRTNLAGQR